jgi:hypothetical protein
MYNGRSNSYNNFMLETETRQHFSEEREESPERKKDQMIVRTQTQYLRFLNCPEQISPNFLTHKNHSIFLGECWVLNLNSFFIFPFLCQNFELSLIFVLNFYKIFSN